MYLPTAGLTSSGLMIFNPKQIDPFLHPKTIEINCFVLLRSQLSDVFTICMVGNRNGKNIWCQAAS